MMSLSLRDRHSKEFAQCYEQGVQDGMRGHRMQRYSESHAHDWWLRGFVYGALMGDRISDGEFGRPEGEGKGRD